MRDAPPLRSESMFKRWTERLPPLHGDLMTLREVAASDVYTLFTLFSDPAVTAYMAPPPPTLAKFAGFVAWSLQERKQGHGLCFGIVPDDMTAAVGILQVRSLHPASSRRRMGVCLEPSFLVHRRVCRRSQRAHRVCVHDHACRSSRSAHRSTQSARPRRHAETGRAARVDASESSEQGVPRDPEQCGPCGKTSGGTGRTILACQPTTRGNGFRKPSKRRRANCSEANRPETVEPYPFSCLTAADENERTPTVLPSRAKWHTHPSVLPVLVVMMMRDRLLLGVLAAIVVSGFGTVISGQPRDSAVGMRWRQIGPTRAGRARALSGVPSQPNVFYIGFDNGGVWRSTDYGSTWEPIFDDQPTGSIGAIAVAPSDPNIIYVGSGAGIIRPDLAVGDGVYKSTDAGQDMDASRAARHADDRDDRRRPDAIRIASSSRRSAIRTVRTPSAAFSARPTAARRSRRCCTRTSTRAATTCASTRATRTSSTPRSGSSSKASSRDGASAAPETAIFKSTDGGATWKQLTEGLPSIIQANIAIAPSNPRVLYAAAAGERRRLPAGGGANPTPASLASTSPPTPASTGKQS